MADDNEWTSVGIRGIIAATERIKNVSRGEEEEDDRDSYAFKEWRTPADLFAERIDLDAGRIKGLAMLRASKTKSLKGILPGVFGSYIRGILIGHPLSSPLEEINPMQILSMNRRASGFGPGGIGSREAVTKKAQAINNSQVGFVSVIEGPESEAAGVDVRLSVGVKVGSDGKLYQRFINKKTGQEEWLNPAQAASKVVQLPD
jgi:DNA-directed RNA polymerase beta subunit